MDLHGQNYHENTRNSPDLDLRAVVSAMDILKHPGKRLRAIRVISDNMFHRNLVSSTRRYVFSIFCLFSQLLNLHGYLHGRAGLGKSDLCDHRRLLSTPMTTVSTTLHALVLGTNIIAYQWFCDSIGVFSQHFELTNLHGYLPGRAGQSKSDV